MTEDHNYRDKLFTLRDGIKLPAIGLGTYRINNYDILYETMNNALARGYRLFDTASIYGNEEQIGRALRELLPAHNLKREDVFITTKLSPSITNKSVRRAFNRSLTNLGLDYLDMYLIHFPGYAKQNPKGALNKKRREETWLAIVKLYDEGKVNAVGVSNFTLKHLRELTDVMALGPMVNQIEYHPYYVDTEMMQYCLQNNILVQAYNSFGGLSLRNNDLMEDPVVKKIANKHDATRCQVLLAWALQRGVAVIPKSIKPEHMEENISTNLKLTEREMLSLDALSVKNKKYSWDPTHIA
ncbi:unnamed protein product [Danaus chrysippus]|uniref:(African queen) hypothetical protein n=1 Tax=Danaus chrysippus TaxID=151541 RepID=A0A8J2M8I4_9NEOP|nr:unnamed protein product [Danaus chrysippus]